MSEQIAAVIQRSLAWAQAAQGLGWLRERELQPFAQLEKKSPADLFLNENVRPLVVGLFGGTGTGKSSLLNRIAGAPIARTGVERPTSVEVTLYAHESVELAALPDEFPAELTRIARHADDQRRDILWLDMPDIDSAQTENRDLAMRWLGHIDLIIYVVSPERYRDDRGWQVLRERGHRHGWLFVMNRWDEGTPQQIDDFTAILREAGFPDPVVLHTSCAADAPTDDEFPEIEKTIHATLKDHGVQELERLGLLARLRDTSSALASTQTRLGTDKDWEKLKADAQANWKLTLEDALHNLAWPIKQAAAKFEEQPDTVDRVLNSVTRLTEPAGGTREPDHGEAPETSELRPRSDALWDHWLQTKLVAALNTTEISAGNANLAAGPLRRRLAVIADAAPETIENHAQQILRSALAKPGNALQRGMQPLLSSLRAVLPLLALAWVAWTVVTRFYSGTTGAGEFLGGAFAVNSVMLMLSAWGVPWLIGRLLKPSIRKTAARALRSGLGEGLSKVGTELDAAFESIRRERTELIEKRDGIEQQIAALSTPEDISQPASRLVVSEAHQRV